MAEAISKLSELIATDKKSPPIKALFIGKPKSGKTTLIASFTKALLGDVERGSERYGFPRLDWCGADFQTILDQLRALATEPHTYKSFFIDSADWLEAIIWEQILKDHFREQWKDKSIDDIAFAKGRTGAVKYWQKILSALDYLQVKKQMNVGFVCHTTQRTVSDPMMPEHDRWEPKLDKRAAGLLSEWAELIGFLSLDTTVSRVAGKDNVQYLQQRVLYVTETSSYLAGNRFGLTEPIINPDYETIVKAINKK